VRRSQGKGKGIAVTERELKERMASYQFYHVIPLTETLSTPGNADLQRSQAPVLTAINALDLRGKRVLDIGCRDGLYSFAAERRGAAEVIGIDNDLSRPAVEFLIPYFRSKVRMVEMNLFELAPERFGRFDLIIFAGVLYHLRYPVWALKLVGDLLAEAGKLLIETAVYAGMNRHAMLFCPVGADSPYEPTSCTFFNRKGLADTLNSLGIRTLASSCLHPHAETQDQPGPEPVVDRAVFLCERAGQGGNDEVQRYWHGRHRVHSRFGGDVEGGIASRILDWRPV
jgi:SAM-dependent methyltransferase